jgi:hypothetical protein
MKPKFYLLITLCLLVFFAHAQEKATYHGKTTSMEYVPSLASRPYLALADLSKKEAKDKRSGRLKSDLGVDPQTDNDFLASNPHPLTGTIRNNALLFDFEATSTGFSPSDPSGAVGLNHYVSVFNTGYRIFDKTGTPLTGQLQPSTIFGTNGCCDLTISYDNAADRWVMTLLGSGARIAVSDGSDPMTAGWNVYTIGQIQDYQKLSVWSDGYYMTDNTGSNNKVWAMERDEMLAGNPSAQVLGFNLAGVQTTNWLGPQAFNVTNSDLPAPGGLPVVFMQDDAWNGVSTDHIKMWTIDVDWVTPGNSSVSAAQEFNLTPFHSVFDNNNFDNLTQPGGSDIDALQQTIMNQAQFRKFANHNSAVFNFVIDVDASAGELAAIRWMEFRQDDDNMPWTLFQEGTYTAPDGRHAWMASLAMDSHGNIGMGYTSMSGPTTPTTTRVGTYYTGRFSADPAGTMTVQEQLIKQGSNNVQGTRYGDYSKIDVDPQDDKTFWFINEIANPEGNDHVGVFKIAADLADDMGVISINTPVDGPLTNAEQVTITVFNYGINSQSNIPVSFSIDGNVIANEVVPGPVASSTSEQYTFTATGDFSNAGQTYLVEASTDLAGDLDSANDSTSKSVTNSVLGIDGLELEMSKMVVLSLGNNLFNVSLPTTEITGQLTLRITDVLGRTVITKELENLNGLGYEYGLDMTKEAASIYFVTLGDGIRQETKRIIVK